MSCSYSSILFISISSCHIISGCLATGNNGFQEVVINLFYRWNEINVFIQGHNKNALVWICCFVRVLQNIKEAISFNGKHNFFERNFSSDL